MSRSIRASHLRLWLVLGPAAIAIFVIALLSRPERPVQPPTPTHSEAAP